MWHRWMRQGPPRMGDVRYALPSAKDSEGRMRPGIGSHQSARAGTVEWLTPPEIVQALGPFDLDPCAPEIRPWPTAKEHFTRDGLDRPWHGRVWINPPYGLEAEKWVRALADHGNGICLLFARTETRMFFEQVWPRASGILFLRGRLHFHRPDGTRAGGNSGGPSCLIAYGETNAHRLERSGLDGEYIILK